MCITYLGKVLYWGLKSVKYTYPPIYAENRVLRNFVGNRYPIFVLIQVLFIRIIITIICFINHVNQIILIQYFVHQYLLQLNPQNILLLLSLLLCGKCSNDYLEFWPFTTFGRTFFQQALSLSVYDTPTCLTQSKTVNTFQASTIERNRSFSICSNLYLKIRLMYSALNVDIIPWSNCCNKEVFLGRNTTCTFACWKSWKWPSVLSVKRRALKSKFFLLKYLLMFGTKKLWKLWQ